MSESLPTFPTKEKRYDSTKNDGTMITTPLSSV